MIINDKVREFNMEIFTIKTNSILLIYFDIFDGSGALIII